MRWGALVAAAAAVALLTRIRRLAPGRRAALMAQALRSAAARGDDAPPSGLDAQDRHYYTARRAQAGAAIAAGELAEDLMLRSRRSQALFQFFAPVVAMFLVLPALATATFLLVAPMLAILAQAFTP